MGWIAILTSLVATGLLNFYPQEEFHLGTPSVNLGSYGTVKGRRGKIVLKNGTYTQESFLGQCASLNKLNGSIEVYSYRSS